jgi:hypothetical protein
MPKGFAERTAQCASNRTWRIILTSREGSFSTFHQLRECATLPGLFKRGDKPSVRRDLGIATARALQQREFARVYAR